MDGKLMRNGKDGKYQALLCWQLTIHSESLRMVVNVNIQEAEHQPVASAQQPEMFSVVQVRAALLFMWIHTDRIQPSWM